MSPEPLRAAVVGGGVGRRHAAAYTQLANVELVAVCDLNPAVCDALADEFDVPHRYREFERMLDEQRPDLLTIATPQRLHAEMTILAATRYAPRAMLCEKAMAGSLGEALAMLAACDRHGVKLAIGHMLRWYSVHEQARALLARGAIGTPLLATVSLEEGGLMNNGTHLLNYMQYVLGDPDLDWVLANVQRQTDRYERGWPAEELSAGIASFRNGVRLSFEGDIPATDETVWAHQTVTGTDGVLLWPRDIFNARTAVRVVRGDGSVEETPPSEQTIDEMFRRELEDLARWARGEIDAHRGDAHLAIKTQELLMAIYESARTHTLVRMPLRTMASPLLAAIAAGQIPVEYPGRYDIRHRTTLPEARNA